MPTTAASAARARTSERGSTDGSELAPGDQRLRAETIRAGLANDTVPFAATNFASSRSAAGSISSNCASVSLPARVQPRMSVCTQSVIDGNASGPKTRSRYWRWWSPVRHTVSVTRLDRGLLYGLALFFTAAGVMHFVYPAGYEALVPPQLPARRVLVYASGVAEIVCGLLLMVPRWRRLAAWGVVATLVAVYPANVYHAMSGGLDHPDLPEVFASPVFAWLRLPVQLLFIAWAYRFTKPRPAPAA